MHRWLSPWSEVFTINSCGCDSHQSAGQLSGGGSRKRHLMSLWVKSRHWGPRDVRFTPESGHRNLASAPQNRSAGANANTPAKLRVCFTDMARGPGGPKGKRWGEPLSLRRMAERHRIGGDDLLADRPQRDPGKLQMRPGKGNADDSHREYDRGDEMAERQPPAGEHEPDDVAEEPERPGAEIMPGIFGARHRFPTERQQRVGGDIERRARPGNPDDGDRHDHGRDHPPDRHLQTAEHDPQQVQEKREKRHCHYVNSLRPIAMPYAGPRTKTRSQGATPPGGQNSLAKRRANTPRKFAMRF